MTSYNPNIPTGLVNLDVDYQNLKNNFSQLDTTYGVNHVKYSTVPNNGKHTFIEMINSVPSGLAANEGTLYTKLNGSKSDLYYTPDNSGNEYQLSNVDASNFGSFSSSNGWTFLPGGLILQYGAHNNASTTGTITYPKPFTTAVYSITLSFSRVGGSTDQIVRVDSFSSVNKDNFEYFSSSSNNTPIFWMAIGK